MISALSALHSDQRLEARHSDPCSEESWTYQEFADGCSGGQSIDEHERRERFVRLADIGRRYGLAISPCQCKNPGLADDPCHIAGPSKHHDTISMQPNLPFA